MKTSYSELPENYQLYDAIDMQKDKKLFLWLNVLALLIVLPLFPILFYLPWSHNLFVLLILIVAVLIVISLHELIHGFFFQKYSEGKVKYQFHGWAFSASMKGKYFPKKQYQIIGMAPALILNVILILLIFILSGDARFVAFGIFLIHFSGCAGDFYVLFRMRKAPSDILIEDTGVGMNFFKPVVHSLPESLETK